jgi:hypothetical protein
MRSAVQLDWFAGWFKTPVAPSERIQSAGRDSPIRLPYGRARAHLPLFGPTMRTRAVTKGGVMSTLRPLPPRPSLEFARKEAKALLRRLRAGDSDALTRASTLSPRIDANRLTSVRLADAQLLIAREHGFASWPRLVHYIGDVERQQLAHVQLHGDRAFFESDVRTLLTAHPRPTWARRALAAYVPRFYGLPLGDVVSSPVSDDEARLAVARVNGAPSWQVLLQRLEANAFTRPKDWQVDPMRHAAEAMATGDLNALDRVVAAHPELLTPSEYDISAGRTLMGTALGQESRTGAVAQPILDWLAARGFDRQRELNRRLCGGMAMPPGRVQDLLDRGADPDWVAPNGISVLEHALVRYWHADAVEVIATRVTPRKALWIAAGLGDVDGVRRFLDRQGKPTPAARRSRPDFIAVGMRGFMPQLPDADDEELLVETLIVAMLNGRTAVLEYLASRGAPVNSLIYGSPMLSIAVGNAMTAAVESLIRCGADLDLRGSHPNRTPRELARDYFEDMPDDAARRRIVEICGMDPDAVLAERNARPTPTPKASPELVQALALAEDDAKRLGRPNVQPENLLIGLLRADGQPLHFLKGVARMDVERFRTVFNDRLVPSEDRGDDESTLPMHPEADAAWRAAIASVGALRQEVVRGLHVLGALTRDPDSAISQLLARHGADMAVLRAELQRL